MSGFHTFHIETKRLRAMSPRREYPETIAAMNACGMQWSLVTSRGLRIETIRGEVFWWMQCAVLAPGGVFADAGTFFGSRSAPGLANRCMNVLLFYWSVLILLLLDNVTTWDVTANEGEGAPCAAGTSNMFEVVQTLAVAAAHSQSFGPLC